MSAVAKLALAVAAVAMVGPLLFKGASHSWASEPWHRADRSSAGLAPDPQSTPEAVVQVYAAPTFGWRGIFAVHAWIAVKDANAARYDRWDVMGWGGGRVVRQNYDGPDHRWFGREPTVLADIRGDRAAALIPQIRAAVAAYPWPETYRTFPGPNSNTFVAFVSRRVPDLGLDLPPTAIGKDFRPLSDPIGRAPSGGGLQVSLLGLAGLIVAPTEGIEVNLLGLGIGLDIAQPALRLPGIGRVGASGGADRPRQ
ncbi:DUF3750 domain-containing protein [Thalassobaculum salexigens]|uniref:DUF3750 domain-containing protein n=1 Tax=Thalassobaculum salexigens TaxID=455360 RepID=UPI00041E5A90|nr:DUF3750 domain-containing protein [Thalassobaculum salexigens]